ncbi:phosphotransferase [Eubacterium sp.]|uniref:phosphotransferase n=1 Tax=Eubacterium sp. TaxID=142586 RepID=UPI0025E049CE|nr:phosphotransferase [Eubacterium sp.]MCR5628704.1 phosphotransferase [Eubacterium sp.]
MNVKDYLDGHEVIELKNGQSGADVYMVDNEYILKHVVKEKIDGDAFDTYKREALFYQAKNGKDQYVPEIKKLELSENEIILIMKKYLELNRADIDEGLIGKVANLLALVHSSNIPNFLNNKSEETDDQNIFPAVIKETDDYNIFPAAIEENDVQNIVPEAIESSIDENSDKQKPLSSKEIEDCVEGWKSVLAEHPGVFAEEILDDVAANINDIISLKNKEKSVLIHGDFHWENILKDDDGNLILCDWQGVKVGGPSEDLSFFLSRLGADGVSIDEDEFLNAYADAYKNISGEKLEILDIKKYIWASRIITSFLYWHYFLHGSDTDRVKEVYEKMSIKM